MNINLKMNYLLPSFMATLSIILIWSLVIETQPRITENSLIEIASGTAWLMSFMFVLWRSINEKNVNLLLFSVVLLFFGILEFELHKYWTAGSVLKIKYYLDSSVLISEKLVAGGGVIIVIFSIIKTSVFYAKSFYQDLRLKKTYAVNLFYMLFLLTFTKLFLDGLQRKLGLFDIVIDLPFRALIELEEVIELVIAVFAMIMSFLLIQKK